MRNQFLQLAQRLSKDSPALIARTSIYHARPYASLAVDKAKEQQAAGWLGTSTDGSETKSYVNGKWEAVGEHSLRWYEVKDPVSESLLEKQTSILTPCPGINTSIVYTKSTDKGTAAQGGIPQKSC